jgi:hypothetical protein
MQRGTEFGVLRMINSDVDSQVPTRMRVGLQFLWPDEADVEHMQRRDRLLASGFGVEGSL